MRGSNRYQEEWQESSLLCLSLKQSGDHRGHKTHEHCTAAPQANLGEGNHMLWMAEQKDESYPPGDQVIMSYGWDLNAFLTNKICCNYVKEGRKNRIISSYTGVKHAQTQIPTRNLQLWQRKRREKEGRECKIERHLCYLIPYYTVAPVAEGQRGEMRSPDLYTEYSYPCHTMYPEARPCIYSNIFSLAS